MSMNFGREQALLRQRLTAKGSPELAAERRAEFGDAVKFLGADDDEVLAAALWEDQDAELRTKQTGGGGTGSLQDPRGDPSVRHEREDPQETTRIALTVFINEIPKRRCT